MQGTMWLFPNSQEWGLGTREPRAGSWKLKADSQKPKASSRQPKASTVPLKT